MGEPLLRSPVLLAAPPPPQCGGRIALQFPHMGNVRIRRARPSSQALAKAAICAVGSVPLLRPFSCPPPRIKGFSFQAVSDVHGANSLGAWTLCPLTGQRQPPGS